MSSLFILSMAYRGIGPAICIRNQRQRLLEEQQKSIEEIKEMKEQTQKMGEQTHAQTEDLEDISRRLDALEIRYGIKKR